VVGNKLYFSADDGSHGRQLWSSDGTAAGTKMVKDIIPAGSSSGSGPAGLVALGTKLLFEADDGTHGTELWVSDGSAAGTHLVKDVNQSTGGSSPYELTTAGDSVFFVADDGVHGPQLWATGPGGTARLTSFTGAAPNDLTAVGNTLYFIGPDSAAGFVLWSSDGTVAGTHPVTTIGWGSTTLPIGGLSNLTDVGGKLYFVVDAPGLGQELFTSNGTAAGTKLVKQIAPNPSGPYNRPDESLAFQPPVSALIVVGNKVFFSADDGSNGDELWASDGSAAGTHMVKDINPGSDPPPPNPWGPPGGPHSSNPNNLTAAGGKLYFSADDGTHGRELWSSDGTAAGTTMVKDVNPGGDGAPNTYIPGPSMVALGGKVFFLGDDGVHGPELWVSDGTAGGTQMVKDIRKIGGGFDVPGGNGSVPADLTVVGHQVFFSADDGPHGRELWVSDGTSGGTHLVKDIADQLLPGDFGGFFPASSSPQMLTAFGGVLYFQANDGVHGPELWVSDGTSGGTHLVQDINPGPAWAFQPGGGPFGTSMAAGPNGLYFAADDGTHGIEVWKLKLNHAPTASAGGPYLVTAGQGVTLDATGSSDPDGDKLTYSWDLNGDGVFGDATGANPTLTSAQLDNLGMYPRPMPYQVRVRVDDGQGHVVTSAPVNLFVRVAPVTVSGLDFEVSEGATFNRKLATVFFNNPEVAPPPAGAYKATIDWGDGTTSVGTVASVNGQLTVSGKHNYSHLGSYAVRVSVSLHGGAPVTATATATVDDAAFYVARGSVPATAGRAFHGVVATIQDTNPSGRAGDFTATIDWGDGTTSAGVVRGRKAGGFEVVGDHTYAHTGPRTVQVHVTSVGGKTVTVQDVAAVKPVSLAGQGRTLIVFADKPFTGDLASFTDADPTAWYGLFTASINWGDGHTSKGTVRAEGGKFVVAGGHEYPAMGQYAVVVTVTDRSGDTLTIKGQVNAVAFTGAVKQLGRFRQEFGSELGLPAVA
jgi:ELWxxDGT repeat protein